MNLHAILESFGVARWHTRPHVPAETIGHHVAGVQEVIDFLTDDQASAALLRAARRHDAPELLTGDIPHVAKQRWEMLRRGIEEAEGLAAAEMGLKWPELSQDEGRILALADRLQAFLYINAYAPAQLEAIGMNRAELCRMAWAIGPDMGAKVEGVLK